MKRRHCYGTEFCGIRALPAPAGFGSVILRVVTGFWSMPVATCCTSVGVPVVTAVTLVEKVPGHFRTHHRSPWV